MSAIRKYREQAGMTQVELAVAAGLNSQSVICNYETGRRTPDIHTLKALLDVFRAKKIRVSLEDLVDDKPEAKSA